MGPRFWSMMCQWLVDCFFSCISPQLQLFILILWREQVCMYRSTFGGCMRELIVGNLQPG